MKTHFINFFLVLHLLISSQNSHAQSTSSVRSDGTILYNGQPFFPFGFYGVEQNCHAWIVMPLGNNIERLQ